MRFDEILVGNKRVADSGSFIVPPSSDAVTLSIEGFYIELEFEGYGGAGESPKLHARPDGTSRVVFTLTDFNNPLGTAARWGGLINRGGVSYDFHIMIHAIGEAGITRLVSYTLLEEQASDA